MFNKDQCEKDGWKCEVNVDGNYIVAEFAGYDKYKQIRVKWPIERRGLRDARRFTQDMVRNVPNQEKIKMLKALRRLVMSFSLSFNQNGLPLETLEATYALIDHLMGEQAAMIFNSRINQNGELYYLSDEEIYDTWNDMMKT